MRESGPKTYWVYILASKPRGVLYTGLTSDLAGRGWQHRERLMEGFAKNIGCSAWSILRAMTTRNLLRVVSGR